jgi:uncharacterized membrane protein (UPF0127 family)
MNSEQRTKRIHNELSLLFLRYHKFIRFYSFKSLLLVFCLCFPVSCSSQKLAVWELPIERDGQQFTAVKAEIARTGDERSKGLMYRKKLPDGEGMLFIFERDEVLSFWMKNTYIPLSIAFIASDGKIIDIKDMYPQDENSVVSSRSVRYALEVPMGWFLRAGVQTGDTVIVKEAIN